jgi:hypothetical protein
MEIEALLAAAGNADPAMWEDEPSEKEGDRMHAACESGQEKLRAILFKRRVSKGLTE